MKPATAEQLIDQACALADERESLPAFLGQLSEAVGASMAHFFSQDQSTGYVQVESQAPEHWLRTYQQTYGADNPIQARITPHVATGDICRVTDFWTVSELQRLDLYQHLFRPFHMHWGIGLHLQVSQTRQSVLTLNRAYGEPDFADEEVSLLKRLMPHLRRSIAIREQLVQARLESSALTRGLECVGAGAGLLDSDLRVVNGNALFMAWLADGEDAYMVEGRVRLRDRSAQRRLRLLATSIGKADVGAPMRFPASATGKATLTCMLDPRTDGNPYLLVLVKRGCQSDLQTLQRATDAWGFSLAQCQLLLALGRGQSVTDYATENALSRNTVKVHLAELFRKTGTSRQPELVAWLARLGVI